MKLQTTDTEVIRTLARMTNHLPYGHLDEASDEEIQRLWEEAGGKVNPPCEKCADLSQRLAIVTGRLQVVYNKLSSDQVTHTDLETLKRVVGTMHVLEIDKATHGQTTKI